MNILFDPWRAQSVPAGSEPIRPALENDIAAPAAQQGSACQADLIAIIEGEIIPRLFLAHRDRTAHRLAEEALEAGTMENCVFLAGLFLGGDSAAVVARIEGLLQSGMKRERIYRDLLAPVPRTLSQFWSEGRCSFEEIAAGLRCIDEVLAELHAREGQIAGELH